jgi:hypothetical protein
MNTMNANTTQALPPEGPPAAEQPPWLAEFLRIRESLPTIAEVPFSSTPEGQRTAQFKKVCDAEFLCRINRSLLKCPEAFDRVALWDGTFPGPCAIGVTDTAKSRSAWSALARLYIKHAKPFAWFPVKRLVSEMEKYDKNGRIDEFFRNYSYYRILFVDDIDKINWDFESQPTLLFSFYDWIYRTRQPCITTTNKSLKWWTDKMGDAFARRLFASAHFTVDFRP